MIGMVNIDFCYWCNNKGHNYFARNLLLKNTEKIYIKEQWKDNNLIIKKKNESYISLT